MLLFPSHHRYEMFLQDTAYLGLLESYPQLTSRATRIGYRISKVVYRGYQAPHKLQVRWYIHTLYNAHNIIPLICILCLLGGIVRYKSIYTVPDIPAYTDVTIILLFSTFRQLMMPLFNLEYIWSWCRRVRSSLRLWKNSNWGERKRELNSVSSLRILRECVSSF